MITETDLDINNSDRRQMGIHNYSVHMEKKDRGWGPACWCGSGGGGTRQGHPLSVSMKPMPQDSWAQGPYQGHLGIRREKVSGLTATWS